MLRPALRCQQRVRSAGVKTERSYRSAYFVWSIWSRREGFMFGCSDAMGQQGGPSDTPSLHCLQVDLLAALKNQYNYAHLLVRKDASGVNGQRRARTNSVWLAWVWAWGEKGEGKKGHGVRRMYDYRKKGKRRLIHQESP
ncbi:uncharacterized protein MCYG_05569 [Microsporum canis CBS 113480]|uniref:Uncharacterized protein n=1 Tax=Arthroderma otae (strain ATCC MYA-4605 / CBS 113480) TaxID=554155 RepID=C5FS97_ARTOC|nr:uncharacterized protein MCYG_05569 [Microsporum canis CBS 113480]EEQ32750.1 predicted protein [Microsporum canis CBS 113480]